MRRAVAQKTGSWSAPADPDRWLTIALGVSCLVHAAVLGVQLLYLHGVPLPAPLRPTKLIYEHEAIQSAAEWARGAAGPQPERLKELVRAMKVTVPSSASEGVGDVAHHSRDVLMRVSKPGSSSGVEEEAVMQAPWDDAGSGGGAWAAAVDLTNVAEAAHNNPVLLGYFGAIREQIQRTANTHGQVPAGSATDGIVYIGFVLSRSGAVQSAAVVPERSVSSPQLREIALQIVKASSPFLPFPPSFKDSSKTIIIPIEFTFGS